MDKEKTKAVFVTFYSFKGGVGRSMALINTAGILAGQRGFRVLVIDVDLEAPGLSYIDPSAPDESPTQAQRELPFESGFVDILTDAKLRGEDADLFTLSPEKLSEKYTKAITIPQESRQFPDGSLRIMPAGRLDAGYAARLNALNIGDLYRSGIGEPLIRAFKKKVAEAGLYDYVLIDSRTGLSDEAGMCTRDLADHLMILSGLNRQNVEGTCEFLRALRAATGGQKTVQIILSPVPNGEDELYQRREDAARNAFRTAWKPDVELSLQIPYHPQLALTEEPHIFRRRKGYLVESYRAIERSMLHMLGHTAKVFYGRVIGYLRKKEHAAALRELQHMIRLERGRGMLSALAQHIVLSKVEAHQSGEEKERNPTTVNSLVNEKGGVAILEFIIEYLPATEHDLAGRRLAYQLRDTAPELAKRLYVRLAEAFPNDADILGSYATFLASRLGDLEAAESYYKRALLVNPNHANSLGDYGQLITATGRFDEGEAKMQKAFELQSGGSEANMAELCFSLWLVSRMQGHDGEGWERRFKTLIEVDFDRHFWSFDKMLDKARETLSAEEFKYAQALAAAFLDAEKVADLASFSRWTALGAHASISRKSKPRRRKSTK